MRCVTETPSLLFEAVIVPHRSLSRRGLRLLLAGIFGACTLNASLFVAIGAWPVGGFTGVELVLAALLLRLNVLSARASEMVLLTSDCLRIVRTDRNGARRESTLSPHWLRAELRERPGRVSGLVLVSRDREEEIAKSLGETEKRDLAASLATSLHALRHPVFDNPQLEPGALGRCPQLLGHHRLNQVEHPAAHDRVGDSVIGAHQLQRFAPVQRLVREPARIRLRDAARGHARGREIRGLAAALMARAFRQFLVEKPHLDAEDPRQVVEP